MVVSDLVAWCFHSPRRLLLVVAALIAVLIGGGALVQAVMPRAGDGATDSPSSTASVAGSGAAVDAAVTFTRAWASKPASASVDQWRQGLQPLVTPYLGRLLAQTDPASLPGGAPAGQPSVRFASVSSALIEVPLNSGRPVLVTVVQLNGHWLAQDVEPLAGDSGAVSPGAAAGSIGVAAGSIGPAG
jgi:hypothetical protein